MPLVVIVLWLVRSTAVGMVDTEVRHGVLTRAVVRSVDGDSAIVAFRGSTGARVVTRIATHRSYAVGDTVAVVHDAANPRRASEQDAPLPSTPLTRGLVLAGLGAIVVIGTWLATRWGRSGVPAGPQRPDVVRGGRVLQPELTRS